MSCDIRLYAPAKINLHLRVREKRADGYHDIESVFQQIRLCDELAVCREGSSICKVTADGIRLPEENTVTAAFRVFSECTGIRAGARVHLVKHIPAGAGLGGGSSDAAAMLKALDALYETRLSVADFLKMAERVGSDVPFFITGGAAVVTGRGEYVKKLVPRTDFFLVVIYPEVHSSTGEAYHLVDDWRCDASNNRVRLLAVEDLESEYGKPPKQWAFQNSFMLPLVSVYPVIGRAVEDLRSSGAQFAAMTGSGSAVFGLFNSYAEVKAAYAQLCQKWKVCFLTAPSGLDKI